MAEVSPDRDRGQAPGLVESPDSILGRPTTSSKEEDDPLLELDEGEASFPLDEEEQALLEEEHENKFLDLLTSILKKSLVHLEKQVLTTANRIIKSKQERQRYQVAGIVLVYIVFMYLCTWSVKPIYGVCPAYNETLAISVAWRLERGRQRPRDTCGLDPDIEAFLEEREKNDVFVRLLRPVTFLPTGRRRSRRHAANTDHLRNETTTTTTSGSNNATASYTKMGPREGRLPNDGAKQGGESADARKEDARWVSLRYGRRTYNPFVAIWRFILRRFINPRRASDEALLKAIEKHAFPHAFSQEPLLSDDDMDFLEAWSDRLTDESPDWHRRVASVAWGGRSKWWHPVFPRSSFYPLETIDGANLLYPYYQAMQPYMRDENHVRFPRRQCASGCNTQVAILSTLEWRENYMPWMVTPHVLEENDDGWVYARGVSKPSPYGRHGIVWLRVGQHSVRDNEAYTRAILHSVDRAIGEALRQGRVGRVNLVLDAEGYEWGKIPDIHEIKHIFGILQDHYPGRLGAVFLCNMSPSAEILFSILKPLLSKEVLNKIYLLPLDDKERNKQLESVIPVEYMPSWLGGSDTYEFNVRSYYPSRFVKS